MIWQAFIRLSFFISACSCATKGFGSAKHTILIGCDGFGGMYLENATSCLPTFKSLMDNGVSTTRARDQIPTISAPNWATMITGEDPVDSGVFDNNWLPTDDAPPNPTVGKVPPISGTGHIPETMWRSAQTQWKAQGKNATVAVSISWDWIHYLVEDDVVNYSFRGKEDDRKVTTEIKAMTTKYKPELMFVHFDEIDDAGHSSGWGSSVYYKAAQTVDGYIAEIIQALQSAGILQDTLIIVTADHGGWMFGHGMNNEACVYIPAIFYGAGVKKGCSLNQTYVTDQDFAPTMLNALGLNKGRFMRGKVVEALYC
jgi:predicted AlkP superfamily pyrophosphatase or phosphodiesterase